MTRAMSLPLPHHAGPATPFATAPAEERPPVITLADDEEEDAEDDDFDDEFDDDFEDEDDEFGFDDDLDDDDDDEDDDEDDAEAFGDEE